MWKVTTNVVLNRQEINRLLTDKNMIVGQDIMRRTLLVHSDAVRNCPVRTGRLRVSLRWVIGQDTQGPVGIVGSDVNYAAVNEERVHFLENALQKVIN